MRNCKTCGKELPERSAPHCNLICFENRFRAKTFGRYLLPEEMIISKSIRKRISALKGKVKK